MITLGQCAMVDATDPYMGRFGAVGGRFSMNPFLRGCPIVALLLGLAATTGCSVSHGDPKNPSKNSHPVRQYEVTATVDSPGPWDSVKGYVSYEIANVECTPRNDFLGVHQVPEDRVFEVKMSRVDERTWRGFFYQDYLLGDDYYGLGVCQWKGTQFAPAFAANGVTFSASELIDESLKEPQRSYYRKSDLAGDLAPLRSAPSFSSARPEYTGRPQDFFPVTVVVKEAKR